jgi:hypothetical protein
LGDSTEYGDDVAQQRSDVVLGARCRGGQLVGCHAGNDPAGLVERAEQQRSGVGGLGHEVGSVREHTTGADWTEPSGVIVMTALLDVGDAASLSP